MAIFLHFVGIGPLAAIVIGGGGALFGALVLTDPAPWLVPTEAQATDGAPSPAATSSEEPTGLLVTLRTPKRPDDPSGDGPPSGATRCRE